MNIYCIYIQYSRSCRMPISMHTFKWAFYFRRQSLRAWKKSKRVIMALLVEFHLNSSCNSLHVSGSKNPHRSTLKQVFLARFYYWLKTWRMQSISTSCLLKMHSLEPKLQNLIIQKYLFSASSQVYHIFHFPHRFIMFSKCWAALLTFVPVFSSGHLDTFLCKKKNNNNFLIMLGINVSFYLFEFISSPQMLPYLHTSGFTPSLF